MRVTITQLGGFDPSIVFQLPVLETDVMPAAQAQDLRAIVEAAHFFKLPLEVRGSEIGSDLMRYQIEVSDGDRRHQIVIDAGAVDHSGLGGLIEAATGSPLP